MSCKSLPISSLRHRITIEKPIQVQNDSGGLNEEWVELAKVSAAIKPLTANQVFYSEQNQHRVTHKITMRYRNDLKTDMRIRYGNLILQVRSFINVGMENRITELMAEEGAAS